MAQVRPRVTQAAEEYSCLWFVLYQGTFGPGEELKHWLDETLYPVSMDWGTESLFLSYVATRGQWHEVSTPVRFGDIVSLEAGRYALIRGSQEGVAVDLQWRALQQPQANYRVVLQVWDETGTVHAQRDVRPANWEHPTLQWAPDELVDDHHGLLLTEHVLGTGMPLHLALSLYDTDTGVPLPVAGGTFIDLGTLEG
jgi:hypothetical protein